MISVAIDGPSGAGKSTLAKYLAEKYRFIYIDTGAMYRAVGWWALSHGTDPKDEEGVKRLLPEIEMNITHDGAGVQRVSVCGTDVSEKIRTPEVSMAASDVSKIPAVRLKLVELQREIARQQNVVMDGRDIGTYVLPESNVKIFLTASPQERAQRRYQELLEKGVSTTYDEVLQDIIKRDKNDSSRAFAPLKKAEDAVELDTTGLSLQQACAALLETVSQKLGGE
ncbi:MAG: (d)CMP kinase [Clostridia bacterium]|nr:(d)CMP kinase [Clostridia bacterium]